MSAEPLPDCPSCGHTEGGHEVVIRAGATWFTPAAFAELPEPQNNLDQAEAEGRIWWWCGHCEDGCHLAGRPSTPNEVNDGK